MTSKQTISRESRGKRYWEKHLEALQRSGLSRAEYCRRQSLPYHALTYWQHKLGKAKCDSGQLVPVPMQLISSLGKPGPGCLPRGTVRIVLSGNLAVEVADDFTPTTLAAVLAVLEAR